MDYYGSRLFGACSQKCELPHGKWIQFATHQLCTHTHIHIQTPIEFMIHIHSMNNAIIPKESRCKLGACVRSVCIGYPPVQCVLLHYGNLPLVSVYFAQNGIADTKWIGTTTITGNYIMFSQTNWKVQNASYNS